MFRFLFQSDFFGGNTLLELIDADALAPVLSVMRGALEISMAQTKKVFLTVFLYAHGYAGIIANNSLKYDEIRWRYRPEERIDRGIGKLRCADCEKGLFLFAVYNFPVSASICDDFAL